MHDSGFAKEWSVRQRIAHCGWNFYMDTDRRRNNDLPRDQPAEIGKIYMRRAVYHREVGRHCRGSINPNIIIST